MGRSQSRERVQALTVTGIARSDSVNHGFFAVSNSSCHDCRQLTIRALGKLQGSGSINGNVHDRGLRISRQFARHFVDYWRRDTVQDAMGKLLIELASAGNFDSLQSTSGSTIDGR